jgi:hypothetical protein
MKSSGGSVIGLIRGSVRVDIELTILDGTVLTLSQIGT